MRRWCPAGNHWVEREQMGRARTCEDCRDKARERRRRQSTTYNKKVEGQETVHLQAWLCGR